MEENTPNSFNLLNAFRYHYSRLESQVHEVSTNPTDTMVLERLEDDLFEYQSLARENSATFDQAEFQKLEQNLAHMLTDVRILYNEALEASHYGRPSISSTLHTGRRGRPRIVFDPHFLSWVYGRRSISDLARFYGVGRTTLRNALIEYGILVPASQQVGNAGPAQDTNTSTGQEAQVPQNEIPDLIGHPDDDDDELLEPRLSPPDVLPEDVIETAAYINHPPHQSLAQHSTISDQDLDNLIIRLRSHYRRAGVAMMRGMLRRLGHRVQVERIRSSLLRIDPVHRVFDRIRIRRRKYSVAGPNALWHHDGQHGLIHWGIVIHGFIDGYSRLITGLQASDNNFGTTVLDVFLRGTAAYGVPSRLRGDHGTENILIAAWMEDHKGVQRGSYIWGRSVHNVRIERLWVDVTAQVGATWSTLFTTIELRHGLDINNVNHLWLLHFLFLGTINQDLSFFAEAWNEHVIQIRDGPNRSPLDMFNFDMFVSGVRGDNLGEIMTEEELEVYGIDWEALHDDRLLESQRLNNDRNEEATSWIGRIGPPENLNEVRVESLTSPFSGDGMDILQSRVQQWMGYADDNSVISAWTQGLACAHQLLPDLF